MDTWKQWKQIFGIMKVIITKPDIPILWLDTWFILELAAALLDERNISRKTNAETIVDKIISLTKQKKLLCPEGDQDIEIGVSNNAKIVDKAREILAQMSLGLRLTIYISVEHLQLQRMMSAAITKQDEVVFEWKDILREDPIRTIDRNDKFIVSVNFPRDETQVTEQIRVHKSIANDWENLRQTARKNKTTYQETLAKEFNGNLETIIHVTAYLAAKKVHNIPITNDEFMQALDIIGTPLSFWEHYSGHSEALVELLNFYRSDEYKQIPSINIGARLLAELVSGNEAVQPSDVMDIHHIATVLPYASYMVVDKRVRNRLEGKTKLLKDYDCKLLRGQDLLPMLANIEGGGGR